MEHQGDHVTGTGDDRVLVFDTTLRDGEQSPGIALDPDQKLAVALQLERLGVDVVEAGFPVASQGDFDAVHLVASTLTGPRVAALCRTHRADLDRAYAAVAPAGDRARLHVFIATSELHMAAKLRMTRDQVLEEIASGVGYARSLCGDVEFSPEDGYRSDRAFLLTACQAALDAGATTINLPDTVGFATPESYADLCRFLLQGLHGDFVLSTHCHDDLGLAVANSLAGVAAGARQVECAVNGLGERAGNAALEEVVVALATRADQFGVTTGVDRRELLRTSKLVSHLTGYPVQFNKAVVGRNAFAHESGIHQHGVLADRRTYEVVDAESVGQSAAQMVLGKHSGRHAFRDALEGLGHPLSGAALDEAFRRFKELADQRGDITTEDLEVLAREHSAGAFRPRLQLQSATFTGGTAQRPSATVVVVCDEDGDEVVRTATASGSGAVDAVCAALAATVGAPHRLVEYRVESVTGGLDALAKVFVELASDEPGEGPAAAGRPLPEGAASAPWRGSRRASGTAVDADVVAASARAYLAALDRLSRPQR